jgi:D-proline reductase (dithiol) PrdB
MSDRPDGSDQAADHHVPIPYRERIGTYYQTLGYGAPYRWAHFADAPFAPLKKSVAESRIGLITTAAPFQPDQGDQGPGAAYNGGAKFYRVYSGDTAQDHDLRISHIGYDRAHTTATDSDSWFPLPLLREAAKSGRIGELAPRFHGAPTNRSQRVTLELDCPELLARVREDNTDAVVLVAV